MNPVTSLSHQECLQHRLYRPEGCEHIKLMLRFYRSSDDIAFQFGYCSPFQ